MRKVFLFSLWLWLTAGGTLGCAPRSVPPVQIDLSTHSGKAPLEVVGYVFFSMDYRCAEITWQYWYSGFSMDKNEYREKVCNRKVVTHEFMFTVPGRVSVQVLVKVNGKTYRRRIAVNVGE